MNLIQAKNIGLAKIRELFNAYIDSFDDIATSTKLTIKSDAFYLNRYGYSDNEFLSVLFSDSFDELSENILKKTLHENKSTAVLQSNISGYKSPLNALRNYVLDYKYGNEWIISGNPTIYDFINAFKDLGTIDWTQSANIKVGDIVYIYGSSTIKALKFKCFVNKVDKLKPTIDDSKYNLSSEFDGLAGRYMELDALEEFNGEEYSREVLKKHGFSSPLGPVHMPDSVRDYLYSLKSVNSSNIDYLGLLKYLENNMEVPYIKPSKATTEVEHQKFENMMLKGQWACSEIKKLTEICSAKFGLSYCSKVSWLDGSGTKTKRYLWAQMKYSDKSESPISVSFFVEQKSKTDVCFRVSLELKNDSSTLEEINKYHTHLNMPISEGLAYFAGINEFGRPKEIYEPLSVIKQKVAEKTYRKVQIGKCITKDMASTNDDFEVKILKAIKDIIPYYNSVVDKSTTGEDEWKPSLDEYDPGISKEKWIEILNNKSICYESNLVALACMYDNGGEGSCTEIDHKYKIPMVSIRTGVGVHFSKRIIAAGYCKNPPEEKFWPVVFIGKQAPKETVGSFIWKIRPELYDALTEINVLQYIYKTGGGKKVVKYDKNMILYGPPGTGKTYNTVNYAVAICEGIDIEDIQAEDYNEVLKRYREYIDNGRIAFTTFHQSYGYEEFIEGIKPVTKKNGSLTYIVSDGVFKKFCKEFDLAWKDYMKYFKNSESNLVGSSLSVDGKNNKVFWNESESCFEVIRDSEEPAKVTYEELKNFYFEYGMTDKQVPNNCRNVSFVYSFLSDSYNLGEPRVFIIDEINRGNISKIFGELITLIEDTKRDGEPEASSAILPYSGKKFSVPSNVYILGTMNTADRSIAIMDTALRRRFQFVEMMPDSDVLLTIGADKVKGLNVAKMLDTINARIEFLYDREHTIGHAFFTSLKDDPSIENLKSIFEKKVIPLLQEYFYEDYQKIRMVLGDDGKPEQYQFITESEVDTKLFKSSIDNVTDIAEKKYNINKEAFDDIESYIRIY